MRTLIGTLFAAVAACATIQSAHGMDIAIDFGTETGQVKPVHAAGQGPLLFGPDFSMFRYLKEAGVPYARLHDVGGMFGQNLWVDIPNIFRDFDADENDPKNYDFTFTDLYLKALVDNGVEPYFRLGVTIENYARSIGKPYRIFPPKDFAKWARICEHVIHHYTEGWANGYKWKITYWEIWNEADDRPDDRNPMWLGTWRQFCELYDVTSKHLKAKFPHLKIGGYGKCSAHNVTYEMRGKPVPEAEAYRHRCKAGYGDVELHLNEWLCGDRKGYFWKRASLASVIAAFIAACQIEDDLWMANIYDARCAIGRYAPLFDPIENKPGKAFYALKYFNTLYRMGTAVKCEVAVGQGKDGLWVVAAKGKKGAAVFAVNDSANERYISFDLGGRKPVSCRVVDDDHTDEELEIPYDIPSECTLAPHSVMLVTFE